MLKAVFPGSFDPFTVGHEALVHRALSLFDKVIIAVGYNNAKQSLFSLNARLLMINTIFENEPRVEVHSYEGLTVDFCRKHDIYFLVRGLRTSADFEFERTVGQVNKLLEDKIETVFMLASAEHTAISSSVAREILENNGNVSKLVPQRIQNITDYLSVE